LSWAGGKFNVIIVLFELFFEDECGCLIVNFVGCIGFVEEVEMRIVEIVEGNLFFVEEMLLMLIDDGWFVCENGCWVVIGDVVVV